jgi:hypothetical protein
MSTLVTHVDTQSRQSVDIPSTGLDKLTAAASPGRQADLRHLAGPVGGGQSLMLRF